jgi:hypothetical protein
MLQFLYLSFNFKMYNRKIIIIVIKNNVNKDSTRGHTSLLLCDSAFPGASGIGTPAFLSRITQITNNHKSQTNGLLS